MRVAVFHYSPDRHVMINGATIYAYDIPKLPASSPKDGGFLAYLLMVEVDDDHFTI